MNERIKQLALQAGVTGYFAAGTELATPIPLSPEMEKFAQLIVRECIGVIEDSEGYSQYFPHVTENIEKHFGVAE